jgi:hypothetical protein
MKLNKVFTSLHHKIEGKNFGEKITNKTMSKRLGCCEDTYARYKNGSSNPEGLIVFLKLLNMLDKNEDIIEVVRNFKK